MDSCINQWTSTWVTWLERPKGVKDEVKQTRWAQSRSGSPGVGGFGGSGVPGGRHDNSSYCLAQYCNLHADHDQHKGLPSFASSLRSAKPLSPGWDVGGKRKRAVSQISGWGWFWPPSPPSQGKRKPPIPCIAFWPTHLTHRQTNLGRIAQQMHSWNKILEFIYIF